jgi:hypothetical protein
MAPPDQIGVNVELGEYGTPSMKSGAYNDVQDQILNGLAPVWRREVPIRQAVTEIVRKVNDLLRQAQLGEPSSTASWSDVRQRCGSGERARAWQPREGEGLWTVWIARVSFGGPFWRGS